MSSHSLPVHNTAIPVLSKHLYMDAWKIRFSTAYLSNMDPKRKFGTARSLVSLSIGYRAYPAIVMPAISTITFAAGIGTINAV